MPNSLSTASPIAVSVVVVTRNRGRQLGRLLTALRVQDHSSFEVLVVHGPSESDDSTESIVQSSSDIRYFKTEAKNIAHARNIGWMNSIGRTIAFIDDDAIPEPNWLSALSEPLDGLEGLAGGLVYGPDGVSIEYNGGVVSSLGVPQHVDLTEGLAPTNFTPLGANFAVSRSLLLDLGGFDEVFSYYLDESDLALRVGLAKRPMFFCPRAIVIHQKGQGIYRSSDGLPSSYLGVARSKAYFALKHGMTEYRFSDICLWLNQEQLKVAQSLALLSRKNSLSPERLEHLRTSYAQGTIEGLELGLFPHARPTLKFTQEAAGLAFRTRGARLPRIVIAARSFHDMDSGIGRWIAREAAELAQRGWIVTVIAEKNQARVDFADEGYWIHTAAPEFPTHAELPGHVSSRLASVERELELIVDRRGCDVFQYPIWDVEGLQAREKMHGMFKTVVSLHTTYALTASDHPEWFARGDLLRPYESVMRAELVSIQSADLVLANSKAIMADIEQAYGYSFHARTAVVPHGIATSELRQGSPQPRIVFLGRLEPRKGFDIFLKVIEQLLSVSDWPSLQIDVVGRTSHFSEVLVRSLPTNMSRRVKIHGLLSREQLDELLDGRPIVVLPSRYESFGLVAIEAMERGCAVVASRIGGLAEVVDDGVTGFLVDVGDVRGFTESMQRLLRDSSARQLVGDAARRHVLEEFSSCVMGSRLDEVLRRLLGLVD